MPFTRVSPQHQNDVRKIDAGDVSDDYNQLSNTTWEMNNARAEGDNVSAYHLASCVDRMLQQDMRELAFDQYRRTEKKRIDAHIERNPTKEDIDALEMTSCVGLVIENDDVTWRILAEDDASFLVERFNSQEMRHEKLWVRREGLLAMEASKTDKAKREYWNHIADIKNRYGEGKAGETPPYENACRAALIDSWEEAAWDRKYRRTLLSAHAIRARLPNVGTADAIRELADATDPGGQDRARARAYTHQDQAEKLMPAGISFSLARRVVR